MSPIIGLTTYGHQEAKTISSHYDHHYAIPKDYIDAVTRAGGIPLLIPADDNDWQRLWSVLDGIIVTGGTDVTPHHYNGDTQNAHIEATAPKRDTTEIELLRYAMSMKDKPVLCICRGMQILNVALGGTIHAHIPDIRQPDIHRNKEGLWTLHDCHVETGSPLATMMGADVVHTYSGHHQAINDVADPLQVVATAPDGIIEAVIAPAHPWLVGVQWHPEKSASSDPSQHQLFKALVEAA